MTRILLIDDDLSHLEMLATLLREWNLHPLPFSNGLEALEYCQKNLNTSFFPDIALVDMRMPEINGQETLKKLLRIKPSLPVIMMTAYSDVPDAVESMRNGARDYLIKPLNFSELKRLLEDVAKNYHKDIGTGETAQDKKEIIWGESSAMKNLKNFVQTVGPTEANILIEGESGTGKELVARSIHMASTRANGPFLAINCGAFNENLLSSELFGHEKGAFTGADKKHEGLFMEARGGSLFLDEIGEMPLSMQVKLLRVLQEKEILSVGGKKPQKIDCRIIAATNRNLLEDTKKGLFREDLYYRLNVVSLRVPPLRERKEDLPILAENFAEKFARLNNRQYTGITAEAMSILCDWQWPGNVRELENVMERASILMQGNQINSHSLPENMLNSVSSLPRDFRRETDKAGNAVFCAAPMTLAEVERNVIMETLKKTGNNKTETARQLGITRKTLHAKLNKYAEES